MSHSDIDLPIERLECPNCRGKFEFGSDSSLICRICSTPYPIENRVVRFKKGAASQYIVLDCAPQKHFGNPSFRRTRIFSWLRNLYHVWLGIEKSLHLVTPLDPLYHLRQFSSHINLLQGPRTVLDVGGGRSPYRRLVSLPGDEYWVLEINSQVFENVAGIYCVEGDIHQLPFGDSQFDVIVMTEVLEHLYDPITAIAHCARVLKPGGLLIATTPQYWHMHGWPSDYYRYTNYGLGYICERNGLNIVQCQPMGGPCTILYAVLVLNFIGFVRWHILNIVLDNLLLAAAWLGDKALFSSNLTRTNPDVRGWALLATKYPEDD